MTAIALTDCFARVLGLLPQPLHRALDRWSYRIAVQRRDRRRLARQVLPAQKQ